MTYGGNIMKKINRIDNNKIIWFTIRKIREIKAIDEELDSILRKLDNRCIELTKDDEKTVEFTLKRIYNTEFTESEKELMNRYIELSEKLDNMVRGA